MQRLIALVAATTALAGAGAANAAPSVDIRDAVARVTVIPEDRSDIKVEMLTTNKALPITVRTEGAETIVDGGLWGRIHNCNAGGDHPSARVRGVGRVDYKDMPQVVIHAPRDVVASASGAIIGDVGRSASLDLHNSGCSQWTIADVVGDASLHDSGAGRVRMGASSHLEVRSSGASQIHATAVRHGLAATLSGAGQVTVESVDGPLEAHVSGVGQVSATTGHVSSLRASISGAGSVTYDGVADSLDASISGIGSVRVRAVTGPISKSVSGMGRVTVGGSRT